jgi:excisionase family DNA binding protein
MGAASAATAGEAVRRECRGDFRPQAVSLRAAGVRVQKARLVGGQGREALPPVQAPNRRAWESVAVSLRLEVELTDEQLAEIAKQAAELIREQGDGWLNVPSAAEHLACGKDRIYHLVSARRIPPHRDGSRLLFDRAELDHWVRRGGGLRP